MDEEERRQQWYEHALSVIHHPVALVGKDMKFKWANSAFQKLVGYSSAELQKRTWMSITVMEDVGGDLAAAQSIIKGETNNYTTAKHYQHKDGTEIPIVLTVWRYPLGTDEMLGFSVEAIHGEHSHSHHEIVDEIRKVTERQEREATMIYERLEKLEMRRKVISEVSAAFMFWLPLITAVGAGIAWFFKLFQDE